MPAVVIATLVGVVGYFLPDWVDGLQSWAGFIKLASIVLMAAGGLTLLWMLVVFLAELVMDTVGLTEPLVVSGFGLAGLVVDAFVDFGAGWDPGVSVMGTAVLAAGATTALYGAIGDLYNGDMDEDEKRGVDAARIVAPLAAGGVGAGTTLIVVMSSFALWTWVWMLLALATVVSFALVLPGIGYYALWLAFDEEPPPEGSYDDTMLPATGGSFGLVVGIYLIVLATGLSLWTWLNVLIYLVAVLCLIGAVVGYGVSAANVTNLVRQTREPSLDSAVEPDTSVDDRSIAQSLTSLAAGTDRVYALLPRRRPS